MCRNEGNRLMVEAAKEDRMADQRNDDLPEGTDTVIEPENIGAIETDPTARDQGGETITIDDTALVEERKIPAPRPNSERSVTGSGSAEGGLAGRIRDGRERLASQAGDKARGLVTQGLERTSETLANVARMVGDTAPGIDDRLGEDYGEYARRAAGAIENVANAIAGKDPDELIEDTRNFVRNSPGIALAGAAVVGFVVARLLKSGLARDEDDDED
jgi:ElaB/YqjD/DUF883 family membrane-anchored ribosome-binding protein